MDYFLMHECIFKILIKKQKIFILNFLKSLDISISDYLLFDLKVPKKNTKVDIILISNNLIINLELNKKKISLKRNKLFLETLIKLLPDYQVIQININLFAEKNTNSNIFNYYQDNEYLKFITSLDYLKFQTNKKEIIQVQQYLKSLNQDRLIEMCLKEDSIKNNLDQLFKEN